MKFYCLRFEKLVKLLVNYVWHVMKNSGRVVIVPARGGVLVPASIVLVPASAVRVPAGAVLVPG